jgi:PncC family amidohydrolase
MKLLGKKLVNKLIKKKLTISIAESCTGGLFCSSITSISGSSKVFSVGLITYSNQSKTNVLKVPKKIIKKYGAVSEQVSMAMVKNVNKIITTNISVSITGIAGPNGGTKKKARRPSLCSYQKR